MKKRALALVIPFLFILTLTAQAIDARMERVNLELYFDGTTAIYSDRVITCTPTAASISQP